MKELPQVTIGKIKEDSPEVDWRNAPDEDDTDPTSAPTWLIQLLGFDPFQEEAETQARADADWDESKHPRNEKGQFAKIGATGANPIKASGWKKTGGQLGSNPGGVYQDPDMGKHYVKFYANPNQGKAEALAGEVLGQMGIETTTPEVVDIDGKQGLAVKWNENLDDVSTSLKDPYTNLTSDNQEMLAKMFAGAILVKNWDVVGLVHDNIALDKDTGKLVQMDLGGSFEFRAQGKPKPYDEQIGEWDTFQDPSLPSGKTFKSLFQNPTMYATALQAVKDINMENVQWAFKQSGLANAQGLFSAFKQRRLNLINQLQNKLEDEGLDQHGDPISEYDPSEDDDPGEDYDEGEDTGEIDYGPDEQNVPIVNIWEGAGGVNGWSPDAVAHAKKMGLDPTALKVNEVAKFAAAPGSPISPAWLQALSMHKLELGQPKAPAAPKVEGPSGDFIAAAKAYLQGSKKFKTFKNDPAAVKAHNANLALAKKLAPPGYFEGLQKKHAGKKLNTQAMMSMAAKEKPVSGMTTPAPTVPKVGATPTPTPTKTKPTDPWNEPPYMTTPPLVFTKASGALKSPLHGIPFTPFKPPSMGWAHVSGTMPGLEGSIPPLNTMGKKAGSGCVMFEPDGRVWIHKPAGGYGGYQYTFPKGGQEAGLTLQQNALKETFEEQGLKAKITGHVGDFVGDTSVARFFMAEREGGDPSTFHEETEAVHLVDPVEAYGLLNKQRDKDIITKALSIRANAGNAQAKAALDKIKAMGATPLTPSSPLPTPPAPTAPKVVAPKPARTLSPSIVTQANSIGTIPLAEIDTLKKYYSQGTIDSGYISQAISHYHKVKKWGMTISQLSGIKSYTGGGFRALNMALRGEDKHGKKISMSPAQWVDIHMIKSALKKMPNFVGTVNRGTDLPDNVLAHWKVGDAVYDRAFVSSAKHGGGWGGNRKFEIESLTGKDVSSISSHPGEAEVIFDPDTRFEVISIEKKGGVTYYKLKEIAVFEE